jgi:hypothetical protein
MSDDHDTVVVERGGGGGATAIVAIIVIALLAVGAWYFLLGPGASRSGNGSIDVNVNLPTIEAPAQSSGNGG